MGSHVLYGKVKGVSFENRQDTIKELMNDANIRDVTLIHTTFTREDGATEPAIEVHDYKTKKMLGYIPKDELDRYNAIYKMTAELGDYNGTYYVRLYIPKAPSKNQYHAVKKYCMEHKLNMPMYDEFAYEPIFRAMRLAAHA